MPYRRILTVNETRDNIKRIREAAVHDGAEIHFGERGRDEVVIISAAALAALKAEAARAREPHDEKSPMRGARRPRYPRYVEEALALPPFEGPPDLASSVDDYLYGTREWDPA